MRGGKAGQGKARQSQSDGTVKTDRKVERVADNSQGEEEEDKTEEVSVCPSLLTLLIRRPTPTTPNMRHALSSPALARATSSLASISLAPPSEQVRFSLCGGSLHPTCIQTQASKRRQKFPAQEQSPTFSARVAVNFGGTRQEGCPCGHAGGPRSTVPRPGGPGGRTAAGAGARVHKLVGWMFLSNLLLQERLLLRRAWQGGCTPWSCVEDWRANQSQSSLVDMGMIWDSA